jgi:hypothetical protein
MPWRTLGTVKPCYFKMLRLSRITAARVYRHFGSRDGECCVGGCFAEQLTVAVAVSRWPGSVAGAERRDAASERRMITVSPPGGLLPTLPEPS